MVEASADAACFIPIALISLDDAANLVTVSRLLENGPSLERPERGWNEALTRNGWPAFVLASGSPRRRMLLATLGLEFSVEISGVDEDRFEERTPAGMVAELAVGKAMAVASRRSDGLVIGADTTVALDGRWLGKPVDEHDALRMLRALRGRTHQVHTGIAVIDASTCRLETLVVESSVRMRNVSDQEVMRYIATGEPLDKAGSYGIQGDGRALVHSVEGCFYNVIGMPICALTQLLGRFGCSIDFPHMLCRLESGEPCPNWNEMERARCD